MMPMSRTLKWVLYVALAEMALVAMAVAVGLWAELAAGEKPKLWLAVGILASMPAWVAGGAYLAIRKACRPGLVVAADTQRYNEITLMGMVALGVGVQAWLAGTMLGIVPKQAMNIRFIEALCGVFIMMAGNFVAKTSPPKGERAPDPAAWTRGMMRIGWVQVAAGFLVLVVAFAAPIDLMGWLVVAVCATSSLVAVGQMRIIYRRPA